MEDNIGFVDDSSPDTSMVPSITCGHCGIMDTIDGQDMLWASDGDSHLCQRCYRVDWMYRNPDPSTDRMIYELVRDWKWRWIFLHYREYCIICEVSFASQTPSSVCYNCAQHNPYIKIVGKSIVQYCERTANGHVWKYLTSMCPTISYDHNCPCSDCPPWPFRPVHRKSMDIIESGELM